MGKEVFVNHPPVHKHYAINSKNERKRHYVYMKDKVMEFITGVLFGAVSLLILKSMM